MIEPPPATADQAEIVRLSKALSDAHNPDSLVAIFNQYPAHGKGILAAASARKEQLDAFAAHVSAVSDDAKALSSISTMSDDVAIDAFVAALNKYQVGEGSQDFMALMSETRPTEEHQLVEGLRIAADVILKLLIHKLLVAQEALGVNEETEDSFE